MIGGPRLGLLEMTLGADGAGGSLGLADHPLATEDRHAGVPFLMRGKRVCATAGRPESLGCIDDV